MRTVRTYTTKDVEALIAADCAREGFRVVSCYENVTEINERGSATYRVAYDVEVDAAHRTRVPANLLAPESAGLDR